MLAPENCCFKTVKNPAQLEHLYVSLFLVKLLALLANIRLGWKYLIGANT